MAELRWGKAKQKEMVRALWRGSRPRFDVHSVLADPLFVAPALHDYHLRAQSPAKRIGFRPLDLGRCGPRGTRPSW